MDIEKLIVKLEIIGKIKASDKLHVDADGDFSIDHNSWYNSLSRWYASNNRKICSDKIEELLLQTTDILNQEITENNERRLVRSIHNAISGLRALLTTYQSDLCMVSNIENIIDRFLLLVS